MGVQFGLFSPDEIVRRAVVAVDNYSTYDGKAGGLFDARMGVLENGKLCRSCGHSNHHCPGHFGYYRLARPVYWVQYFKLVMKVLRCVCVRCSRLLLDKVRHAGLLRLRGEARWRAVVEASASISRCGQETEEGCGARQPDKFTEEQVCRIFAEWRELPQSSAVAVPGVAAGATGAQAVALPVPGPAVVPGPPPPSVLGGNPAPAVGPHKRYLEPDYVYRLLQRVSDEDVEFMGFDPRFCRPDWMMCTVLPVPPPQVRPSVMQDNNQRSEDDLTQKLIDIIKTDKTLVKKLADDPKRRAIDEWTNLLQYHVATLVDNNIPGLAPSAQRSGRPLKSLAQRLGSKEGRVRNNLQGKRVEHSARSVITPDPNISVAELGVPLKIATNLTYPEQVTTENMARLQAMVRNGPEVYPGAKTVARGGAGTGPGGTGPSTSTTAAGRVISLKHIATRDVVLHVGDIVHRHMLDGDYVLFNRQPSLHRMSMMSHKVRVLPGSTFRLNVSVTRPYNADFDGDEMNLHLPQTIEAATELRLIAAVPLQMISPRESTPIVSVVQDTLVGVNRFTKPGVSVSRREAMNLLMYARRWGGELPEPAGKGGRYTGGQLFSTLLPDLSVQMPNKVYDKDKPREDPVNRGNYVRIEGGVLVEGVLDKDVFSKGLVHVMYNDHGPDTTVDFLDSLQSMVAQYLISSGFSVGVSDLVADEDTHRRIGEALADLRKQIAAVADSLHTGTFANDSGRSKADEFEARVFGLLNKAVGAAGKVGLASLSEDNRMTNMVKAGSKGESVNIAQMIATLGQQNVDGKRIPLSALQRTLPHFKRFDDGPAARGFIESSFMKGLQPHEFFFHAAAGREGLIDTVRAAFPRCTARHHILSHIPHPAQPSFCRPAR